MGVVLGYFVAEMLIARLDSEQDGSMDQPSTWSIEQDVREDAESIFVPTEQLPDADTGDIVEISSSTPVARRRGRLVDRVDDAERGTFVVVRLEPPIDQQ